MGLTLTLYGKTKNKYQKFPSYFNTVTVKDAIGNLPKTTKTGEIKNPTPITDYQNI